MRAFGIDRARSIRVRVRKSFSVESTLRYRRPCAPGSRAQVPEVIEGRHLPRKAAGHAENGHALGCILGHLLLMHPVGDWCPSPVGRLKAHVMGERACREVPRY